MDDRDVVVRVEMRRSTLHATAARIASALVVGVGVGVLFGWAERQPKPEDLVLEPMSMPAAIIGSVVMVALLIGAYELLARSIAWGLDRRRGDAGG